MSQKNRIHKCFVQIPDSNSAFLVHGNERFSFIQLKEKISFWKNWLEKTNFTGGTIMILGEKCLDLYAIYLACIQTQTCFIPIGNKNPTERIKEIIRSGNPDALIALEPGAEPLPLPTYNGLGHCINPSQLKKPINQQPEDTAYILFTSGSSGVPKGVRISYSNIHEFIENFSEKAQSEIYLSVAGPQFDVHLFEFFMALRHESTLVVYSESVFLPSAICKLILEQKITCLNLTPSQLHLLLLVPEFNSNYLPDIKSFFIMGENFQTSLGLNLKKQFPQALIYNAYGPTECCIIVTAHPLPENWSYPYLPICFADDPNIKLSFIENNLAELIIQGNQVGIGYTENDIQASFRENNYYTGDLAKEINGRIVIAGRKDEQIKYHGHRIEPEEIISALKKVCGTDKAHICYQSSPRPTLIAFIERVKMEEPHIKSTLKMFLPEQMIPSRIVQVEEFPLNLNGKVDEKVLLERFLTGN